MYLQLMTVNIKLMLHSFYCITTINYINVFPGQDDRSVAVFSTDYKCREDIPWNNQKPQNDI